MIGPADEERATAYAELLRQAANQPVQVGGEEISRAVSLGVALGEPGSSSVSELMNQADQAMLQAKSRGGNEICMFTAEMRRQNEIRTDIELHLVTAIRNGSLVLHYQPQVALAHRRHHRRRSAGSLAAPQPRSAATERLHRPDRDHQPGR